MFRILVVEDDKGIRALMEDALADAGYEPLQACNGLDALEVLETKHVDLIVLDIMMPKMDGYELLKQIRQAGMDMPVLLVTAKQTLPDKKKGFLLGADDYMVKPFEEEEMLLRIAALLRRAKILTERKLTVGNTELIYDSLTVTIRDEGIGISPSEIGHIFDKFYQVDTAHSSVGNGLGLPLVYRIVQLSGGAIHVKSEVGKGTEFTVTLPVSHT